MDDISGIYLTKRVILRIIATVKHKTVLRNRVKELRSRLNLRQADLAQDTGVTRQTILAIEKGRLNPSIALSLRIARVLREPVDYVFHLERVAEPRPRESVGAPASDDSAAVFDLC